MKPEDITPHVRGKIRIKKQETKSQELNLSAVRDKIQIRNLKRTHLKPSQTYHVRIPDTI